MYKLPFYIGIFISYFVPGHTRRQHVRGWVNVILYYLPIKFFIKRVYGERAKKIRFVRQITLNRMICVVNDKYYVKVFRNVSVEQLNNYKFLLDFIRPNLKVQIPEIFVAKHIPMYVSAKLPGKDMRYFDRDLVIKNEKKIKTQVFNIISDLQHVSVDSIPNKERFFQGIQIEKPMEKPTDKPKPVLAHFDLNPGNLLLDNDLNIVTVIDWDALSVAKNPNTDKDVFERLWERHKVRKHLVQK